MVKNMKRIKSVKIKRIKGKAEGTFKSFIGGK